MQKPRETWKGLASEETLAELTGLIDGTSGSQKTQIVGTTGNVAVVSPANTARTSTDKVVLVQNVDSNGSPLISQRLIRAYKATITLGANTNPYGAGDVILDVGGALGVWDMSASPIKTSATILGIRVQTTDATGLVSKNLRFHIYNDSVTPIADNAPFVISDVNEGKREGAITVTIGSGNMAKVGRTDYENLNLLPVAGKIYFVLEDVNGHTPSANSTVLYCYLKVELGN